MSHAAEIDELWNPAAGAYFDNGRDTPGIAVLHLDVLRGHYWSSPSGRIGALLSMIKAKSAGAEQSGEHGPVSIS